eukprot:COSAG03_NODE_6224_length_1094_cov_613.261307_1_plen_192_part_00
MASGRSRTHPSTTSPAQPFVAKAVISIPPKHPVCIFPRQSTTITSSASPAICARRCGRTVTHAHTHTHTHTRASIPAAHPPRRRSTESAQPHQPPGTRRHADAAHQALPCIPQPRFPNRVARLREERVPEGRADERGAQRIVLGYVLEDHSEGTPFVEDAEGGAAQRIHRAAVQNENPPLRQQGTSPGPLL